MHVMMQAAPIQRPRPETIFNSRPANRLSDRKKLMTKVNQSFGQEYMRKSLKLKIVLLILVKVKNEIRIF